MYRLARSSTSGGLSMSRSSGRAMTNPNTPTRMPASMATVMAVCTPFSTACLSPAPKCFATMTLAPTLSPMNTLMIRLISDPVLPTAARDAAPAKRPTTTISAAL